MGYMRRAERNDYALSLLIYEPRLSIYANESHIDNKLREA